MNCCKCKKPIDTSNNPVPPVWFGSYTGQELRRVICVECIGKAENKEWWKDGSS